MAKILITGGAGYIGSHTALELLNKGYEVVVYDNLSNSSQESLRRVEELTGKKVAFYEGDILDKEALTAMFKAENVDAVIHCAALKAVGESVQKPLEYYQIILQEHFLLWESWMKLASRILYSVLPLRYTEVRKKCRSQRLAQREHVPILTDGQSL